jgi:predicted ribosome quality control (RQC) complex YloA/Tae2 family protein
MLTDWLLIGRLARELDTDLRGTRVDDAGLLADGRIAIRLRRRGAAMLLAVDLFASTPLLTVEEGELAIGIEPGFVRALARSLRGMTLQSVAAREHDRLIRLRFASRSRFGVGDTLDLYLELVPRFGNIVLVKDGRVVGAHKEFALAENPTRAVQTGSPYALPPVPANPRTLEEQPAGSALAYFAQLRSCQTARIGNERVAARRRAILKRLDRSERKLRDELTVLMEKRRRAEARHALRAQGDEIFATLHELEHSARDDAKDRAAGLFAEYKKLAKSLPHLDARENTIRVSLEAADTLRWEAERAGDEEIDAVETAVAELNPRRRVPAPARVPRRKRPLLELRTPRGSRILVGRSPIENAELTFKHARPGDLWFHAQRIPGAHVILARDDRGGAPDEDLELAASLAAYYSRAKNAATVAVDYTQRKHVRKQRAAPAGLVWYTNAKTLVVAPQSIDSLR